MAAPPDWPSSRTVPTMPLAPPLRSGGAEVMMARILGDWKKPKPAPHSIMRQTMLYTDGWPGIKATETMPRHSKARPTPPSIPDE